MRIRSTLLAAATAAMALSLGAAVHADDVKWLTSFDDAKAAAKKDKKLVLADCTGSDWCVACHKLHKEVFETKEFQEWADKRAVLLELDYPLKKELPADLKKQNEDIKQKYKVESFPSVIFFDADGNEVGRLGYVKDGPKAWIKAAEDALDAAAKKAKGGADAAAPAKTDAAQASDAVWLESYDKAAEAAAKGPKVILADFTGSDWCPWCIKLRNEVFETKEFKAWAAKNAVLLEVDFPHNKPQSDDLKKQNEELETKYKVEGYPTVLVLDEKGAKIGELGYEPGGPEHWIDEAKKVIAAKK